jgi:phytoene dehydrogenase-like protein
MIIIVGAGLAGLVCAKELVAAGQQVLVLEASDRVGGRVCTDMTEDGYRLDRGFQVLFTAYPAVQRHLDLEGVKQRHFDPGAILVKDGKRYSIADPLREPASHRRRGSSLLSKESQGNCPHETGITGKMRLQQRRWKRNEAF